MKIGLVSSNGVNSADAMLEIELGELLRKNGQEIIPIIQSEIGSSGIISKGFSYKIADLSRKEDAKNILSEFDVIILTKEASPKPPHGNPRKSHVLNKSVIDNIIEYTRSDARIVYLSSISVLGEKLAEKYKQDILSKEKKFVENRLRIKSFLGRKRAYILRIGHVMGAGQQQTKELIKKLENGGNIYVDADGNLESNTIHISVLVKIIIMCQNGEINPGKYTVVNTPQWTWKNVIEYYAPDNSEIYFYGKKDAKMKSVRSMVLSILWRIAEKQKQRLVPLLTYLPEDVNNKILNKHRNGENRLIMDGVKDKIGLKMEMFSYHSVKESNSFKVEVKEILEIYEEAKNDKIGD